MVSYYHNMKKGLERIITFDSLICNRSEIEIVMCWKKSLPTTILARFENQTHGKGSPEEPMRLMILVKWPSLCFQASISCMCECMCMHYHTSHRCTVHLKYHPLRSSLSLMPFAISMDVRAT